MNGPPATRDQPGGNGNNGWDGGNGGCGTDGSNGGRGGTIEITVDEQDMDLLFLLEELRFGGGLGGKNGKHG